MRQIHTTIDIPAAPEAVWEVLTDFPSHAEWNPFFASIEGRAAVGEQLRIVARKGEIGAADEATGMRFTPTVLDVEPARLLQWRGRLLMPGVFDGTHRFELTPTADGGTRLDHSESFRGALVPFVGRVLKETEAGFKAFNQALEERVTASPAAPDSAAPVEPAEVCRP